MSVLVVYAHPSPQSFNHAVLEEFTKGLKDGGHSFEVVDLHAIGFDPRTKLEDLAQFAGGQMPKDVLDQQEKVVAADTLVFIYPKFSASFPAILKGWIDRVFSYGFAYQGSEKGMEGLLKHQKALLIDTTGFPEEYYKTTGLEDAFRLYGSSILSSIGIQNVDFVSFYAVPMVDDETRKKYLETAYRLGKEF
ncbi:MAG: NAD(P)H-dependent oxidoreductase [Candidatus Bathyarchaeota archaeon]|nr:MAG: NAD(P)H-dependent oxidoreductase [Candidatus Bathyarchaeota archaeon]